MNLFKPNGSLDVATAATDLPEDNGASGAMQRCKNLSLDEMGKAATRPGSSRVSDTQLSAVVNLIVEQGGSLYEFTDGQIYKDEASIESGMTPGDWSACQYNAFNETTQQIFCLNGTDRKRISGSDVNEWGIDVPDAPTAAAGSGTALTGDYKAKVTFARLDGTVVVTESNPSDASAAVTLSGEGLSVTWTPSNDDQVTHVRVYRTLADGDVFYFDQSVAVGTASVITTTSDADLGTAVETDHNRPPAGGVTVGPLYGGIVFILKDNSLYWSKTQQPEYFPTANSIEVGPRQFPLKTAVDYNGQLYCLSEHDIWYIQGTGTGFRPVKMKALTGAPHTFGALSIEGQGIYHVGPDGIYLFAGQRDRKITQSNLEPIFRAKKKNGIDAFSSSNVAWLARFENRLYFHYGSGAAFVFNLDNNRVGYYKWDTRLFAPTYDRTNERFLAGDASRRIRVLEDRQSTDDAGTGIDWEIESKDFTLQTRRHFPRWAKYDVDGTATASILLDDEVHQTHALTVSRKTKRRLIESGNGRRMSVRISGTGAATVYAVEVE